MANTVLKHGAILNAASREEIEELLRQYTTRQQTRERVRAGNAVILDAAGTTGGPLDLYEVPTGFEFEARRVVFDLGSVTDSNMTVANVNLAAAGFSAQYLRSGTRIEWAVPSSPVGGARIPGIQTWGSEQGPYLRNGEVFQVRATLGAGQVGVVLTALVEGILSKAGSLK